MIKLFRTLDAFFKLLLFRGQHRFLVIQEDRYVSSPLFRVKIRLIDRDSGFIQEGVGEGESFLLARLRALAESYERILIEEAKRTKKLKVFPGTTWGAAVALRSSNAVNKALAEYFERAILPQTYLFDSNLHSFLMDINTIKGPIYISGIKKDGFCGTGYGLSKKEAENSSLRCLLRTRDFKLEQPIFERRPFIEILLVNLTPKKNPWLECYVAGHFTNKEEIIKSESIINYIDKSELLALQSKYLGL